MTEVDLKTVSLESFKPAVGDTFKVLTGTNGDVVSEVKLASATALPRMSPDFRDPFSLIFEGSASEPLQQNTYVLSNDRLGVISLFIVPVWQRDQKRGYQAIFN